MNALHFDTLKFARKLKAAGLTEEAAEAIAEGVGEFDASDLATKGDIAELRAATKTDIAELRADLYRQLWIMAIGIVGLTVTLIKLLP